MREDRRGEKKRGEDKTRQDRIEMRTVMVKSNR